MESYGLYESASVKIQILKTAIEVGASLAFPGSGADDLFCVGCQDVATGRRRCPSHKEG